MNNNMWTAYDDKLEDSGLVVLRCCASVHVRELVNRVAASVILFIQYLCIFLIIYQCRQSEEKVGSSTRTQEFHSPFGVMK